MSMDILCERISTRYYAMTYCEGCFQKQIKIEQLQEEIEQLKDKLRYRQRKETEGFFGSSTPSSKLPVKANVPDKESKPRGAKPGHKGSGRKSIDLEEADRVETVESSVGDMCPYCNGPLSEQNEYRTVIDRRPLKAERILYVLPKKHCSRCKKTFRPAAPGVLPKSLYGNQLIATAAEMHYLHGIPMGRISEQIGVGEGSLVEVFHRLARLLDKVPHKLIEQYRQSPVKHADETGWRINGKNGYAWLFATEGLSIFQFKPTRSAKVPQAVFGKEPLPGTLVVDRYAGYNKAPCALQYCYAHLLREVEDLEKEFPESEEVKIFTSVMAPLLTEAMKLRNYPVSDKEFYRKAAGVKSQIIAVIQAPAVHLGIRHIQDIFSENAHRLYLWADDRRVPADNNLAERDLRPTVIARKVSFGSLTDAGAHTRSVLMTVLHSLKKQKSDVAGHLKTLLDQLSRDMSLDPCQLLFSSDTPSP
jgi:transposase